MSAAMSPLSMEMWKSVQLVAAFQKLKTLLFTGSTYVNYLEKHLEQCFFFQQNIDTTQK